MALKLLFTMGMTLFLLFGLLFGMLAGVGYYYDLTWTVVVALAVLLVFVQWIIGPRIVWWTTNMRLIERSEYPWLHKTVKDICAKNNVPVPRLAIARIGSPNAFVFGRTPKSATLAVTTGLLKSLSQDEVKAVVAHEVGHIKHKDMVVMTMVSVVPMIAYFIARFAIFTPVKNDRRDSGSAIAIGLVAFLIYFITNLLVLALSRLREYYSDEFSGKNVNPVFLASALAKITYGLSISKDRDAAAARAFYIIDPITSLSDLSMLSGRTNLKHDDAEIASSMEWERKNPLMRFSEIFRTHPLTYKRIEALMNMERGRGS